MLRETAATFQSFQLFHHCEAWILQIFPGDDVGARNTFHSGECWILLSFRHRVVRLMPS